MTAGVLTPRFDYTAGCSYGHWQDGSVLRVASLKKVDLSDDLAISRYGIVGSEYPTFYRRSI